MFDPTKPMESQYQDPFASPLNPLNATRGNWGIDPMYLTPGYTANYRPAYAGPQGYSAPQAQWGMGQGMLRGGLGFNPINPDIHHTPMYMDSQQWQSAATDAVWNPMETGTSGFMAHGVAPFAAWALGEKIMGQRIRAQTDWTMATAAKWKRWWGDAPGAARAASTRTIGGAAGANLVGGATSWTINTAGRIAGVEGAAGTAMGSFGVQAGRLAGSVAGRLALPLALGEAAYQAIDYSMIDPYVSIRRGRESLRRNFSNQYIGAENGGSSTTGFGLSRRRSSEISAGLTRDSIGDTSFQSGDYNTMMDYATRAGMMNDLKDYDVDTIRKRMKSIVSQVKTVMAVANEPSLQEAVQMLAKLKQAGATDQGGFAGTVLRNIGLNAATSGISTQQMMNTVGATGQYLYQSQGLTPFVGMREAADLHAGFSSAFRKNLIDPATLARMGGVNGATQSALQAQVGMASTNYNMMNLYSQYMHGQGGTGSMVGNIGQFGANFARNPLSALGMTQLMGKDMISNQLQNNPNAAYEQIFERMNLLPGGNDVGKFAAVAGSFGRSPDEIRAIIEQFRGARDNDTFNYRMGAIRGATDKQSMNNLSQHGLEYADYTFGTLQHGAKKIGRGFKQWGNDVVDGLSHGWSSIGDWAEKGTLGVKYKLGEEYDLGEGSFEKDRFFKPLSANKAGYERVSNFRANALASMQDNLSSATIQGFFKNVGNYGKFEEATNKVFDQLAGTKDGEKVIAAIRSGDAVRLRKALAGSSVKMTGSQIDEIVKHQGVLKLSITRMDPTDGSTASTLGKIDDGLDKILGVDSKLDVIGTTSLIQDMHAYTAGHVGYLDQLVTGENGELTDEAKAIQKRMKAAGMTGVDDAQGLAAELKKQTMRNIGYDAQRFVGRTGRMQGVNSMEEAVANITSGKDTYGLTKKQIKELKGLNGKAAQEDFLMKYFEGGQKNGMVVSKTANSNLSGLAKATESEYIDMANNAIAMRDAENQQARRMYQMRDMANRLDYTGFEQVKSNMEAETANIQYRAATMQLEAALKNNGGGNLASGRPQDTGSTH